jgi:hypothetical protein
MLDINLPGHSGIDLLGEIVKDLVLPIDYQVLLVTPPFEIRAAEAYRRLKLDLTEGSGDLTQRVLDAIDMIRLPNSIVRLEYKIRETDIVLLNKSTIQEVLSKARFNAGIIPDIIKERTSRDSNVDETTSAPEALKKFIERSITMENIKRLEVGGLLSQPVTVSPKSTILGSLESSRIRGSFARSDIRSTPLRGKMPLLAQNLDRQ